MESAKKVEKERTQTTARRNQNNASERRFGGGTANSLFIFETFAGEIRYTPNFYEVSYKTIIGLKSELHNR